MENSEYEKQYLKYMTLHNYKSERLDVSFCLSEFIDNSISSYDATYWQKNNFDEPLMIEIEFKSKENTYTITDNAGGMTMDELKHAMKIEKKLLSDGYADNTKKNQYGIGMKSAIFWLGRDAHIYTKIDGSTIMGDYKARDMKDDDDVNCKYDVVKEDKIKTNSGTKIVIFDIYSSTRPLTHEKLNKIKEFIGARYSNYLDKNATKKCVIKLITDYKNKKEEVNVEKFSLYNNSSNVRVFRFDNIKISKTNEEVKNIIEEYSRGEASKYPEKLAEFKEKILNNKFLDFNDEIIIPNKIGDRHYKAKVKVYILNEANKKYAGVGIIHSDRYITHPVLTEKASKHELGGMYKPFKEESDLEHRWKWLWVDLKLTDIESNEMCQKIYPDKNKTDILFDENSDIVKDDSISGNPNTSFNSALLDLFKRWLCFIEIVREITNSNIEKSNKNKVSNLKKEEKEKLKMSLNYFSKDDDYKVEVERIETDENVLIISDENNEINNDGSIMKKYTYNIQNKYFDSLTSNNEMEQIIKILIYIENYIKKIDKNFKGISSLIEESINFYSKEK